MLVTLVSRFQFHFDSNVGGPMDMFYLFYEQDTNIIQTKQPQAPTPPPASAAQATPKKTTPTPSRHPTTFLATTRTQATH